MIRLIMIYHHYIQFNLFHIHNVSFFKFFMKQIHFRIVISFLFMYINVLVYFLLIICHQDTYTMHRNQKQKNLNIYYTILYN